MSSSWRLVKLLKTRSQNRRIMLNISIESISDKVDKTRYSAFKMLEDKSVSGLLIKIILAIMLVSIAALFLPWTQNIRAKGYVTTLSPDDRPQNVQSLIGGRIEKWYVQEGDQVKAGDTIILISEVKEEYLDPDILDNTNNQILAKSESANAYGQKAQSLDNQYSALINSRNIKLEQNKIKAQQTYLKLQSDSIDLVAARVKLDIANNQLKRMEDLYQSGLKSLTDLEAKRLSVQEAQAKVISYENKVNTQLNEITNIQANIIAIENEYGDKIAKSRSDKMTALSDQYNAKASINKLQSDYNAYSVRQQNYYIKSPINGTVTKAIKYGIGEMVKNGDDIISIIPDQYDLAVEMYVLPMDMPLLQKEQRVRVQFDGWPAIVFSGWPNNSYGTFAGEIFAIDNFISDNGKYRILIAPDKDESMWPEQVRIGGGANIITLLNNVSVGYELWRQLNGFPPDYYDKESQKDIKTKAPLKKVK